ANLGIPRISRCLIITEVRPSSFSSTPREQESKTCGGGQVQVFPGPRLASKERTRTWGTLAPGQVSNLATVLLYFSLSRLAAGRHTIDTYRVNSTRGFRIQVGIPRGP